MTPRLAWPTRIGAAVEVYPEIGYQKALYDTSQVGFSSRGIATGRVDLRTRLRGSFGVPFTDNRATHLLEPSIGYALVQSTSQGGDPLFVPGTEFPQQRLRQFDLDNRTLDSADRVARFNGVTLGLGNRFYGTSGVDTTPRLLGDVRLSTEYDFSRTDVNPIYVEGSLLPGGGISTRFIGGFDPDDTVVKEGLAEAGWSSPEGHDVAFTYRYLRDIPLFFESFRNAPGRFDHFNGSFDRANQLSLSTRVALTRSWAVTYRMGYSFESSLWLGNQGGVEYLSRCKCWALRVEVDQDRARGLTYNILYRLVGLGEDSVRPFSGPGALGSRSATSFLDAQKPL